MGVHGLLIPEHISADLEREAEADAHMGAALAVDAMLKDLNHRLELVWVGERATSPGLIPCRWHVRRRDRDTGAMDAYFPITGPEGEYVEPTARVVDMMRRNDMWKRDVVGDLRKERDRVERAQAAIRAEQRAENVDTFAGHAKALINPGVSFSDARPWTNRVNRLPA